MLSGPARVPVPVLARAIQLHGVHGHDEYGSPQAFAPDSTEAQAALACLKAYLASVKDPGPESDDGFERDDHDWVGYRYGWYSHALPDFTAIQRNQFAAVAKPMLGQSSELPPFTTLHDLLRGKLASTASLDNAIRTCGVWERCTNDEGWVVFEKAHTVRPLASLAAFTVDSYKGPDPRHSLWGPDNPLHTYGWPKGHIPALALDVTTPQRHLRSEHWQEELQTLFDPTFTTVGCLLITGRAKPSQIAAAVRDQGIERRDVHNLPELTRLPHGYSFGEVNGAMGALSSAVQQLSKFERARQPAPMQTYREILRVLENWGWSLKILPEAFRLPVAPEPVPDSDSAPRAGVADPLPERSGAVASDAAAAKPLHTRTKRSYLAVIGVLLEIIQHNMPVFGFDKRQKVYRPREGEEAILDADIIYTISKKYDDLQNISESRYKYILKELGLLAEDMPEIFEEARNLLLNPQLKTNKKSTKKNL